MKVRKATETTSEFAKAAIRKWVLPKNLIVKACIPGFWKGTLDGEVPVVGWHELLREQCGSEDIRIDVLKVDTTPYQSMVFSSLWDAGLRPSLVLVNWNHSPDSDLNTTLTAGHLQMLGYALIGKEGNRFLYYYTDVNYYETCSWEGLAKHLENPMMSNLVRTLVPGSSNSGIVFPLEE